MINFSSKHSNFRLSANKFIAEYFKPFQEKSIVQFSQSITFGHNQMSSIGSSAKVSEYFNKYKIPIFCSDESGRILDEGIYTNKILEATYRECALIFPLLPTVGKRFGLNYGKNSLYILEKDIDCQHLYTLHFDVEENIFLHWSLNNGQFIKDLIENYKLKGKDLILESKCYKNRSSRNSFNAATLKEYYPVSNSKKKKLLSLLHKNSNLPIFLSRQQTNCLILLISGKSAKQIGIELNLSPRTVEDYLQTVREMLGCSTGK
ncbi:MAG: hypothetical protein JO131_10135, partial [Gammaproteobacteria bacterium]|nr:hypothetical protein [Gammaproteobacteria bacterium]